MMIVAFWRICDQNSDTCFILWLAGEWQELHHRCQPCNIILLPRNEQRAKAVEGVIVILVQFVASAQSYVMIITLSLYSCV
jgi:hypothetical protein